MGLVCSRYGRKESIPWIEIFKDIIILVVGFLVVWTFAVFFNRLILDKIVSTGWLFLFAAILATFYILLLVATGSFRDQFVENQSPRNGEPSR